MQPQGRMLVRVEASRWCQRYVGSPPGMRGTPGCRPLTCFTLGSGCVQLRARIHKVTDGEQPAAPVTGVENSILQRGGGGGPRAGTRLSPVAALDPHCDPPAPGWGAPGTPTLPQDHGRGRHAGPGATASLGGRAAFAPWLAASGGVAPTSLLGHVPMGWGGWLLGGACAWGCVHRGGWEHSGGVHGGSLHTQHWGAQGCVAPRGAWAGLGAGRGGQMGKQLHPPAVGPCGLLPRRWPRYGPATTGAWGQSRVPPRNPSVAPGAARRWQLRSGAFRGAPAQQPAPSSISIPAAVARTAATASPARPGCPCATAPAMGCRREAQT